MGIRFDTYETLDASEEIALAKRIEAGVYAEQLLETGGKEQPAHLGASAAELQEVAADGKTAWQTFFGHNLRLVNMLTAQWARKTPAEYDDVFQEGCVALAEAIRKWDYQQGNRFSTLAWRVIDLAVQRATTCSNVITVPFWLWRTHSQVKNRSDQLRSESPRDLKVSKEYWVNVLAEEFGKSPTWVKSMLAWENPRSYAEFPETAQVIAEDSGVMLKLTAALLQLPSREKTVLTRLFGITGKQMSKKVCAAELGLSIREVNRLEKSGLDNIRIALLSEGTDYSLELAA
jgi:RNA polymerase sigma factor (sigma-70 family)